MAAASASWSAFIDQGWRRVAAAVQNVDLDTLGIKSHRPDRPGSASVGSSTTARSGKLQRRAPRGRRELPKASSTIDRAGAAVQ
jgi:hypothetical protein